MILLQVRLNGLQILIVICQVGYLILGHSEGVVGLTLPLRAVAPTTFRREAAAG